MISGFDPVTGKLPAGEHLASRQQLQDRFGHKPWRRKLLDGMLDALRLLKLAECQRVYIAGGSADPQGTLFVDCFQTDSGGRRKGIVVIALKGLP